MKRISCGPCIKVPFWVVVLATTVFGCAARQSPDDVPPEVASLFADAVHVERLACDNGSDYVAHDERGVAGYAAERSGRSRSATFTVMIALDADFEITRVEVIDYLGAYGREVTGRLFLDQFEGKGPADSIRMGRDIDAITGATLSSRSVATIVREAVSQLRRRFGPPSTTP